MGKLEDLKRQRNACYRQKTECIEKRRVIASKLERLRQAKREVAERKDDAGDIRKDMKKLPKEYKEKWQGEAYDWLKSKTEDVLVPNLKQYHRDVDSVLDDICDEITRLENENRQLGWLLNSICNNINSLGNEIEKLIN